MKLLCVILCVCLQVFALSDVKTLPGFEVKKIHNVNKKANGSWVSIAFDPKGRLYACDQGGSLYRMIVEGDSIKNLEKIESPGRAQGLHFAFDSLYMMCHLGGKSGLYRLQDLNGDDKFEKIDYIMPLKGQGEHGPHSIITSHDGKSLIVVAGNFTELPENCVARGKKNWKEDLLLKHLPDPSGFSADKLAPGGWVLKLNPDGSGREVIATGLRNTYDIAMDPNGQIFGYDADMEWDGGTPWYRPTRVNHIVSGAEFGWRRGTSKWPEYYADSLGAAVNVGPGCPTGVVFGTNAKFPTKYRKALYILDWTFGRIYAIHLKPDGSTYTGEKEVFIQGKPFPVTDAQIGPDGNMYFTIGGRGLDSALYKVTYKGSESTDLPKEPLNELANQRLMLEEYHKKDAEAVAKAWPYLRHSDRNLRFAARIAIENQPYDEWKNNFYSESNPQAVITSSLSMSRYSERSEQKKILTKLLRLDFKTLNSTEKLEYLRALGLLFSRLGAPSDEGRSAVLGKLEGLFPSGDDMLNRELSRVLVYLKSPQVINKSIILMKSSRALAEKFDVDTTVQYKFAKDLEGMMKNPPATQGLHFALILMSVNQDWTKQNYVDYLTWTAKAQSKNGGNSYKSFVANIRKEVLKNSPSEIQEIAKKLKPAEDEDQNLPKPKGPGRFWKLDDALAETKDLTTSSVENGAKMYKAVLCAKCHAFKGVGGRIGPDLTNLKTRFGAKGILEAIIEPSAIVSEQYHNMEITLKDGSLQVGRIMSDEGGVLKISINPFDISQTVEVKKADVQKMEASKVSPMPPGLISPLSPQELRDLILFLTAD